MKDGGLSAAGRRKQRALIGAALFAVLGVASCSSTSLDSPTGLGMTQTSLPETAPAPASRQASADTAGRVAPVAEGPRNTGQFPNLNIPPKTAAPQLSNAEKAQKQAALRAEQRQQAASGGSAPKDQAELAKLGKTHAKQTLEEIDEAARKAKAAAPAGE